jgi:acyl-CoA thioesterase II
MPRLTSLRELFALERSGVASWVGQPDSVNMPHVFGGRLLGQSVVAAARLAVPGREVHSIHTTFLRQGDPGLPVCYCLESLRDGGMLSTVAVRAVQGDCLLAASTVSLTERVDGISHTRPLPPTDGPGTARSLADLAEADGGLGSTWAEGFDVMELRIEDSAAGRHSLDTVVAARNVWMRSAECLGDDPVIHAATIAFASDIMLMPTALLPHGHVDGRERSLAARWRGVSLDHTIRFQQGARADDWLLFEQTTTTAHAGRAVVQASVFDLESRSIAHVVQEALVRAVPEEQAGAVPVVHAATGPGS